MALTPAEKQRAYRDRERVKLEALHRAANGAAPHGAALQRAGEEAYKCIVRYEIELKHLVKIKQELAEAKRELKRITKQSEPAEARAIQNELDKINANGRHK